MEASESTSYRLVPPQGGKNLVIPEDHWTAFMECLSRDDTRAIFENGEKGAQEVYTRLVALGIEEKTQASTSKS